jgi:cardiolipin synthase (CMP-forming)
LHTRWFLDSLLTLANFFTLLRVILAPFVAADILNGRYGRALIVFLIAGITDVVDGLLARRMGDSSKVGAYFDPIADKLLLSVAYVALGAAHAIPWWMVAIVFGRDVLILGMAAYGLLFTSVRQFPPSVWGKISTFFQISLVVVVMSLHYGIAWSPVQLAIWLMVASTIWSGFHYAWRGVALLRAPLADARGSDSASEPRP